MNDAYKVPVCAEAIAVVFCGLILPVRCTHLDGGSHSNASH